MSNLSTFRTPSLKTATGSLTYSANTGVVTYVAPTNLSQLTNDIGALTGNVSVFNSNNTIVQRTFDGRVEASSLRLLGSAQEFNNAAIEIGNLTTATLPYIDFHSSGYNNDFDVRIAATGGANGTSSAGTLTMSGANMVFNAPVAAGSGQTNQNLVNLFLSETGHATSRRAMMQVGTGWQVGQDLNTTGNKDFFIYNSGAGRTALLLSTTNAMTVYGPINATGASFSGQVSANSLVLTNTGSQSLVYTDVNANNIVFRVGPSSAYVYPSFDASGNLNLSGAVNAGTANILNDVHTNRSNNTGYYYMGNANNAYIGFDGGNVVIRAGGGGSAYRQNDSGTYLMYDIANFWGQTRSWYSQNAPTLNLGCVNTGMGTNTGGYGALRIQSYDNSSTNGAFMEFLNQNRFGAYLGLDSDNQMKVGGWSFGNAAYRLHHFGNCNPIIDIRMAFAGDQTGQGIYNAVGGNIWEPYAGAAISGVAVANVGGAYVVVNARWRYVQKQDGYGNWFTVGYV